MASHPLYALLRFVAVIVVLLAADLPGEAALKRIGPRHFTFDIAEDTPLKDLLPAPPKNLGKLPPYLNEDLWEVAEVAFGEPISVKEPDTEKATAHILAKINHLNKKDPDGFLKALLANRADLRGLPFMMGKECRTETKPAQVFAETVDVIQRQLREIAMKDPEAASIPNEKYTVELIWKGFSAAMANKESAMQQSSKISKESPACRSQASQAEVDHSGMIGLVQMLGTKSAPYRVVLAKHLATIKSIEATRALARLAIFAYEEPVRAAAIDGLKDRPAKDYAPVLLQGLRYPLPVTSTRAADALVKLQVKEVLGELLKVLDEPDPRAPRKQVIDGREVTAVRELVRINHHRNCMLCHAPANAEPLPNGILTAPVPLPNRAFKSSGGYGGFFSPDIFVRTDVTYLRQDFSMMMKVENASPWPEMQRFDFFVRTRVLTPEEAAECAKHLAKQGTPPSHLAAQYALRGLTGQTPANATPEAWRRLLKL